MKKTFGTQTISIDQFFESESNGLYYVGHASIIVKINKIHFLFDYVRDNLPYGDHWVFFPSLTENIPITKIDGIFISHVHQDHFDPIFLKSADVKCPIYVIGGRSSFEKVLSRHGIDYINIPERVKTEIAPGIYVLGFLNHVNGVDASCCIGNRDFSVYHGNDNYLDIDNIEAIDAEFANIDVACVPYAYINWYPQLLKNFTIEEKALESYRLCTFYFEYAIEQANRLNATQVIPFGANLCYKDSSRSPLNLECKTPLEFESYVRKTRGEVEATRFKALFANDVVLKQNDLLMILSENVFNEITFRDKMDEYLIGMKRQHCLNPCEVEDLDFIKLPILKITKPTPYEHYICIRNGEKGGVMINTHTLVVNELDLKRIIASEIDYHVFYISNIDIYKDWMNGKINMEEVIGSRQFTVERNPNIYNKEILFIATTQL